MIIKRISRGRVIQIFDSDTKSWVGQDFESDGDVLYEHNRQNDGDEDAEVHTYDFIEEMMTKHPAPLLKFTYPPSDS